MQTCPLRNKYASTFCKLHTGLNTYIVNIVGMPFAVRVRQGKHMLVSPTSGRFQEGKGVAFVGAHEILQNTICQTLQLQSNFWVKF